MVNDQILDLYQIFVIDISVKCGIHKIFLAQNKSAIQYIAVTA